MVFKLIICSIPGSNTLILFCCTIKDVRLLKLYKGVMSVISLFPRYSSVKLSQLDNAFKSDTAFPTKFTVLSLSKPLNTLISLISQYLIESEVKFEKYTRSDISDKSLLFSISKLEILSSSVKVKCFFPNNF